MALTTNDHNSLFGFNQRTNKITEGRAFRKAEIVKGTRVCLISEKLAETNGLSLGDALTLQLYPTSLNSVSMGVETAWPPSPYYPGTELADPVTYEIIGFYSGLTLEMRDHTISPNTVIIPAASFEGFSEEPTEEPTEEPGEEPGEEPAGELAEEPADETTEDDSSEDYIFYKTAGPPILDTIVVPNGGIEEAKALIDSAAEGFGGLFRFYDQGYSTLKPILANLKFGMTWIIIISAVGWAISVSMFSLFYVWRKKKDITLLSGLGVSHSRSFFWAYMQCAIVILLAQVIVVTATMLVFGNILESALSIASEFTSGYRDFTLSDMNLAGGVRFTLPLDQSPLGLILAAAGSAAVLLITSAMLTIRAARRSSLMERSAE